jgi:cold shock CspA family protein
MIKNIRGYLLGVLLITIGLSTILGLERVFSPLFQNVNREVFLHTRAFQEGKIQELTKLRLEYLREKDPVAKEAIASTIRLNFSQVNRSKLPYELRTFLEQIMKGEN